MFDQSNFKDTQEHSSDLALIIVQLGYKGVYDWLMIASGISNVEFSWNRFDKTGAKEWCRPAYEYDKERGDINQKYITELTTFNYIWGAFENLISEIFTQTQINKKGKINLSLKAMDFNDPPVYGYEYIKSEFSSCFREAVNEHLYIYPEKHFSNEELKIIYQLRNKFAHGDLRFPESMKSNSDSPPIIIELVKASSRIILCYIQGLILLNEKGGVVYSFIDNLFNNPKWEELDDDYLNSSYILSRLHLKKVPEDDFGLTLFYDYYYNLPI
ncbi:hypothetical protein DET49_11418 [Salegentibacter sp. 24]|uniref:hypothetical protein n=1 Tax=Salegentibacter sp. 24 TaxID=2183986 RepID=UPI00105FD50B|nr:hypothetical protein [Salegentibacter sp. 24]TDN87064.1 hypothetical protein DET49_11418 [Salegentibacter sp. 24]